MQVGSILATAGLALAQLNSYTSKEALFRTPAMVCAKISPDGGSIAYVGADQQGISNVFVLKTGSRLLEATQLTFFTAPEILQFFWSADNAKVLFLKNEHGASQTHLYGVDIVSKEQRIYTQAYPTASTQIIAVSPHEQRAVIGLNVRNPHFYDLYLLDINSGHLTLLLENNSYAKFLVSESLKVILKIKIDEEGAWEVWTHQDKLLMKLSAEDAFQMEFLSYHPQKEVVYFLDSRFSDTQRLVQKSLRSQEETILGGQPDSDIDDLLFLKGEPKAYASYYTHKKWHCIDPSLKDEFFFLEDALGSQFEIINKNKEETLWILSTNSPNETEQFFLYDRRNPRHLSRFYHPKGLRSDFAKMYPMVVQARDGQKLVCYYTLPKEADLGGSVKDPIPLVVIPHGGPFKVRDKYAFDPYHQWLAACGYGVLSVNFRLSSGFGKAFVNSGNGQWGGKAHFDVIDAVESCIQKGITTKDRLAILGCSYGGYESLAALTFTPDYFTCCVAICGPSHLKTVLDNVPQFWELPVKSLSDKKILFTKQAFITSMGGHPEKEEGIVHLEKCSPLNYLKEIKAPLLLVHGKNDPIVAESESSQIYQKMDKEGKEVVYICFPDEGHGIDKFANQMLFLHEAEKFLSHHLKGKFTPVAQEVLKESSGEIFKKP